MITRAPSLLIVEDSNEDFVAMERFLLRSPRMIPIERCINGEQALAFLFQAGEYIYYPHPAMIILDLNLPGTNGWELLRFIKEDANLKHIPVIVFTTSNNPEDIKRCHEYGVANYIVKPIDYNQLKKNMQMLIDFWFEVKATSQPRNV